MSVKSLILGLGLAAASAFGAAADIWKLAVTDVEGMERLQLEWGRRSDVQATIAAVAQKARAVGAPMLSHADTRAKIRRWFRELGATVAEFPMVIAAAEEARRGCRIVDL